MTIPSQNTQDIWHQYQSTKTHSPAKYARDHAHDLGISEAELAHSRVGHDAVRLDDDTRSILTALEAVGETKCICRNEYAVHEQLGIFSNLKIGEHAGLVLNPRALDLRLFITQWASAFALREQSQQGERLSIQFFDWQGDALLKVYVTANTDLKAWNALIATFATTVNVPLNLKPADEPQHATDTDAGTLDIAWRAMTDVHQFFGLLKKHNITRQQAFRLVGDDLACQISNEALPQLLGTVRAEANEIMIFVGNRGCTQIFTGVLERVTPMKGWLNIFNKAFTLHLRAETIAESWITRKPTADGFVTSLELFAADGTQIAQLYGQRSEGNAEQTQWRAQVDALTVKGRAA